MSKKILILAGDGVGPEITQEAHKLLDALSAAGDLACEIETSAFGGAAIDQEGVPLPDASLALAREADAVLLGAVGGPKWEAIERARRPERGLLALRADLGAFANLRPAVLYPGLEAASTLRPEVVQGLDIMIVRELTGGIYFGEPRGIAENSEGQREGRNTLVYSEDEIERICRVAFEIAGKRQGRVCSVDKANVLEATELWRTVATEVAADYPHSTLSHMYVDNAAMQLAREPRQFDVMVTSNLFGDILSDLAAMLTGSIGMLPSASLDVNSKGVYEAIHGSAPDIAGRGIANPLATLLSVAMMLRYSLDTSELAERVEAAVSTVLKQGLRTADIMSSGCREVGTAEMGDAVIAAL